MLRSEMSGERKSIGACSHNSSTSSIASFHGTWAQEMNNADYDSSRRSSLNRSAELENKSAVQNVTNASNDSTSQPDREISLEFIEGVNEEKFDRLLKEDKLKTPFKRRYSQTPSNDDSRSDSPNDSNGEGAAAPVGEDGNLKRAENRHQYDIQKRSRYNSNGSGSSNKRGPRERETDPAILSRRQKQIEYGKNTVAYERYVEMVPRQQRTRDHPRTPDKFGKYSRRTFDGLIKVWRKQLHYYDPEEAAGTANNGAANGCEDGDSDDSDD